jgi:hypothetical protein
MKSVRDGKRFLVKNPSGFPGGFSERPEIHISEVFHKDETASHIMADQPGNWDIEVTEKFCNVGIVCVFDTLRIVMDQDG